MIKTSILALFSLLFMIFHAGLVTKGAAAGLLLWYSAVVPALFPFMVLSSILSASGGISWLMQPFTVVFRFCGLSADGWYVLLTGLLCGCPMGAKTCADFLAERRLSSSEAKFLFALCNHPSPMFSRRFHLSHVCRSVTAFCALSLPFTCRSCCSLSRHTSFITLLFSPESIPENSGISQQHPTPNSANAFSSKHTRSDKSSSSALSLDAAILNSAEILVKIGGYLIFLFHFDPCDPEYS